MIRLVVAAYNPDLRDGLAGVLTDEPEFDVAAAIGDHRTLEDVVRKVEPDVVVLAAGPRELDPARGCRALRRIDPRIRPLVTLSRPSRSAMLSAFAAGANGVAMGDAAPSLLRTAVRSITAGWVFVDPRLAGQLVEAALDTHRDGGSNRLTLQDLEVTERIALGLSDAEIGERLGADLDEVHDRVDAILDKLGARDRDELATIARREGLS